MARKQLDWEAIETDFRISQLSIRQIAGKFGTEASTITRRAQKEGWTRDLSTAVRAATKTKVRNAVINATQQAATDCNTSVAFEVDLASSVNATIILGQQKRTTRLSRLLEKMTGELEEATDSTASLQDIAEMIEKDDPKAAEGIRRLKSMTTRMNNLKTASEIMGKVNAEERRAFSIDDDGTGENLETFLDRVGREEGIG